MVGNYKEFQKKDIVITIAKQLLQNCKSMNNGAMTVIKSHTREEHYNYLDKRFHEIYVGDKGMLQRENLLGDNSKLEIFTSFIEFRLMKSRHDIYDREDATELTNKYLLNYGRNDIDASSSGIFLVLDEKIGMVKIPEYAIKEFIRPWNKNPEAILEKSQEDYQFPSEDEQLFFTVVESVIRNLPRVSDEQYIATFAHEYLHYTFDKIYGKREIDSTVNEAFSWFCSYKMLAELGVADDSFEACRNKTSPGEVYDEPDTIVKWAKLLWDKYERNKDSQFFSWIIEGQKYVANSSKPDREAFKIFLLPEEFHDAVVRFNSLVEDLHTKIGRLEQILNQYREINSGLPVEPLIEELESLRSQNPKKKERKIIENEDQLGQAIRDLEELMRQEVISSREIGEDLMEFESRIEKLDQVDKKEVRIIRDKLEHMENPRLKEGEDKNALIWDLLVISQRIKNTNYKIHELAKEHSR